MDAVLDMAGATGTRFRNVSSASWACHGKKVADGCQHFSASQFRPCTALERPRSHRSDFQEQYGAVGRANAPTMLA